MRVFLFLLIVLFFTACSERKAPGPKPFYNVDSLISIQVEHLKGKYELNKYVTIEGKGEEHTRIVPDSVEWANELEIFRLIDQINKTAFRGYYDVTESRDTNSNLTVREVGLRPGSEAPVLGVKFYYLRDASDLRKIVATVGTENALYIKSQVLTIEFEPVNGVHLIQRYRIEGTEDMVMGGAVNFVIAGEVSM
jgi:hypothetical protein